MLASSCARALATNADTSPSKPASPRYLRTAGELTAAPIELVDGDDDVEIPRVSDITSVLSTLGDGDDEY